MKFDLVLCGVGGQGVLTTAYVLDHAAVEAGLCFKQPEVHGMAQRGGAVSAQVRLSDVPVASDVISDGGAHLILSVEPMESLRYLHLLRPDGWLITDVTPLQNIADYPALPRLYQALFSLPHLLMLDASQLAAKAGAMKAPNIVVLGAAASLLPLSVQALEKHISALFSPKGERVQTANLKAFRMGRAASAFATAVREGGVPPAVVAPVVARLDFAETPVPTPVVDAWGERLARRDGADVACRVFESRDLLPLDARLPATLS